MNLKITRPDGTIVIVSGLSEILAPRVKKIFQESQIEEISDEDLDTFKKTAVNISEPSEATLPKLDLSNPTGKQDYDTYQEKNAGYRHRSWERPYKYHN